MLLSELTKGAKGIVSDVQDKYPQDIIARRLRDLGFVSGEQVSVLTYGPLGGEPMLVQIGYTRFALRHAEAARVRIVPPITPQAA